MSDTPQKQGNGKFMVSSEQMPPDMAAYMQNTQLMQQIIQHMKEVPILESEKPSDSNALIKVEFPEGGGMLTYLENHPYPYRGFPYFEYVEKIDLIKKISRGTLSGFYHSVVNKNKFRLILFVPLIFVARDLISTSIRSFHKLIERFRIKSHLYSGSVRELYRAFDNPRANEDLEILELRLMLKDIVCTILEFDNAYRYRFQDIVVNLDKKAIKKDTAKELLRLFDLMSQRENGQEIRDTWRLIKMSIKYYLRFDKKIKNMVADILYGLDLNNVALTIEDQHFCSLRKDYTFGFNQK